MEVKITPVTTWQRVYDAALFTVRKNTVAKPTREWKRKILNAEHSPIRLLEFDIDLIGIPYWLSVHLTRHKHGVEHFVSTQRDDRTDNDVPREQMPQGTLVNHRLSLNAQALINISRKRLCRLASKETRDVWQAVRIAMMDVDEYVAYAMQPDCIYRGKCHEMHPCIKSENS